MRVDQLIDRLAEYPAYFQVIMPDGLDITDVIPDYGTHSVIITDEGAEEPQQ